MNKIAKYLIISVVLLLVVTIVGKKAGWFGGSDDIQVATEKVSKRTIYEVISANGKIQPEKEVKIGADVSGEVVELMVKEGEMVTTGQMLVKIKPDMYQSIVDQANAALNSSQSNLDNALARLAQVQAKLKQSQLNFDRYKKLWEQKTISQSDWDGATAEFEMAKADVDAANQSVKSSGYNVKSAEAQVKQAQERLYKTVIYSPMTGVVTKLIVEKGERVAGTDMMAGSDLLRIANLDKMEVKVDVNENDIVKVKAGDTAIIEVDAYLGKKFKGIVSEIANSASTTAQATADQVTSFEVKIKVIQGTYAHLTTKDKPYPFRPGMSASVEIQTERRDNILTIPIQAVTARADSSLKKTENKPVEGDIANEKSTKPNEIVFLYKKPFVKTRIIKTGIQDNNYIEILSGLSDNDEIVVAPYSAIARKLKDSTKVKVVDKKELFKEK